jgi:HD-GYP domain-containing protein (c-di-GMP phosphodiesterase class II)
MLRAGDEEQRHTLDEGLVGWALRQRTALDISDLEDPGQLPSRLRTGAACHGRGALLVLPLLADARLLGALVIGAPRRGAYDAVDRGIVNLVVAQVAAAVRIVLLMSELDGAEAVIAGMARAVEAKDPYTQGHAERVTRYAGALAEAAELPYYLREVIAHAGPLHDVGKIGVPDAVLGKPGRLTDEEFALIKRHAEIGDEICRPLRSLQRLRAGVRHHHERYDGRGYPDALAGEAIPLEARVLAIADTYDAMTSTRPYRTSMPVERALAIIEANEGPQWDPVLVPIFCALARHGAA